MSQASIPAPNQPAQPPTTSVRTASTPSRLTLTDMVAQASGSMRRTEAAATFLSLGLLVCGLAIVLILVDHWVWALPTALRWAIWVTVLVASVVWVLRRLVPMLGRQINPEFAARQIERRVPELKDSLISYVQLSQSEDKAPKGIVSVVGRFAVDRLSQHDLGQFVSPTTAYKLAAALFALLVIAAVYMVASPKSGFDSLRRLAMPWVNIEAPTRVRIVKIAPKSAVVARGDKLRIEVELRGWVAGDKVEIVFSTLDGQLIDQRISMQPEIEGLTYNGFLTTNGTGIDQPISYRVQAGDDVVGPFQVDVQAIPQLAIERIELTFPKYTRVEPRILSGETDIETVEGTRATIIATANQPMASGRIEVDPRTDESGFVKSQSIHSLSIENDLLQGSFTAQLNAKGDDPTQASYRLSAVSVLGQSTLDPILHRLVVNADQKPTIDWKIRMGSNENGSTSIELPAQTLIELPINHVLDFDLVATDADFGVSQVRVAAMQQRRRIIDQTLMVNEQGVAGQVDRTWRLDPVALKQKIGDQYILQAAVADNRRSADEARWAPNIGQTDPIAVRIVAAQQQATQTSVPREQAPAVEPKPLDGSDVEPNQEQANTPNGQNDEAGESGETDSNKPTTEGSEGANGENNDANSDDANSSKGEQSLGDESKAENADVQESGTDSTNDSNIPSEDQAAMGESSGNKPNGDQSNSDQSKGDQPNGDESNGDSDSQAANGQPQSEKPNGEGDDQQSGSEENNSSGAPQSEPSKDQSSEPSSAGASEKGDKQSSSSDSGQGGNQSSDSQAADGKSQAKSSDQGGGGTPDNSGSDNGPANGQSSSQNNSSGSQQSNANSQPSSNGANPSQNNGFPLGSPSGNNSSDDSSTSNPSAGNSPNGVPKGQNDGQSSTQSNGQSTDSTGSPSQSSGSGQSQSPPSDANSNSKGGEKGRLDNVERGRNGDEPIHDGEAFEEIQKWIKENGQPEDAASQSSQNPSNSDGQSPATNGQEQSDSSSNPKTGSSAEQPKPGDTKPSETNQGSQSSSSDGSKPENGSSTGEKSSATNSDSNAAEGSETGASDGSPAGESSAGNSNQPGQSSSGPSAAGEPSNGSQPATQGQSGMPNGGRPAPGQGDNPLNSDNPSGPTASDPANVDYAKKTTDLALEYLDQQRDQPDPELLKRLGWTDEQLRQFTDRWKRMRDRGVQPDGVKQDYAQELRALGLEPPKANQQQTKSIDDRMQGLNEEGLNVRPPQTLQNQFDAFRRAAQQRATKSRRP